MEENVESARFENFLQAVEYSFKVRFRDTEPSRGQQVVLTVFLMIDVVFNHLRQSVSELIGFTLFGSTQQVFIQEETSGMHTIMQSPRYC